MYEDYRLVMSAERVANLSEARHDKPSWPYFQFFPKKSSTVL